MIDLTGEDDPENDEEYGTVDDTKNVQKMFQEHYPKTQNL